MITPAQAWENGPAKDPTGEIIDVRKTDQGLVLKFTNRIDN